MKSWLLYALLSAGPAAAQRPTAEAAQPAGGFWPVGAGGAIVFTAPAALPQASLLGQAEHGRAWLTRTCGEHWQEQQTGADSVQAYRGQLAGVHAEVVLTFALRLARRPLGWVYQLGSCRVGAPTGEGRVQWLPLERVVADADYGPDVRAFQLQLQRALPGL